MPSIAPVRYAVVGLGHIAQVAVLPAFAHARRNSKLVAVVSGDRTKRREITRRYRLDHAFSYEQFEDCLREVDAVYIALPNSMHAEYTVRAAKAGVHVLCEKPMAVTVRECRQMVTACRNARVKLMIAYRLHFETLNISAMELARRGQLGELKFFTSSFSMTVRRGDIRTRRDYGGGTLYDIGVYCINAARNLFRAEPTRVSAMSVNSGVKSLVEIDETTAATMQFGDGQLATFVTSFNAADVAAYRIVGTRGHLHAEPAYEYAEGLKYTLTIDGKRRTKRIGKRDQFAPELLYFSDCIRNDRQPEPSGEEGLQDVRIVEALYESARRQRPVAIRSFRKLVRPTSRQRISRPGVRKPDLIKVQSASRD
ncbi:Glucose--fructose oxidoreductase precursor [Luteitalea pratensis]|uniref:Glucose--fructose oxidoreductase n=2 Tax=Luteitalea pratensis TaxID=1855912 RepID=A0A143PTV9_LUTPR|nr:Glucose--fructose oxidoreductase precursor [Luteitalea pratensis]